MRGKLSLVTVVSIVSVVMFGCGGGGGGDGADSDSSVCTTLKVAGGAQCPDAPAQIVVVATSRGSCTGTFITRNQVLTAGHCFSDGGTFARILNQYFSYESSRVQVHPSFNPDEISDPNDVAVVTIADNAPVSPVAINTSRGVVVGDSVVTYGFGLDEDNETFVDRFENGEAPLKATSLEVIGVSALSVDSISDGTGDTCRGDSGGSLLLTGSNGQAGIVAIVRSGPYACRTEGGASDNTNLQAASVLNFVRSAAPGARFN